MTGADDPEIFRSVEEEYQKALAEMLSAQLPASTHPYWNLTVSLAKLVFFIAFVVLFLAGLGKVVFQLAQLVWGVM